jgi:hypothetical protein
VWKVTDTHFERMSDVLTNTWTNGGGRSVHVLVLKDSPGKMTDGGRKIADVQSLRFCATVFIHIGGGE